MSDPSPQVTTPDPNRSAIDAVFQELLADIVSGVYGAGARLPAERELARTLGASRSTLREALRRLTEWCIVAPRRGSGIIVRSPSEWSIEVLPGYLAHARPAPGQPGVGALLADLLVLRRVMLIEILRIIADRVAPGGLQQPRRALHRAWAVRDDADLFQRADLTVIRALVEAAQFFPALWLLNRLSGVYLEIADRVSGALTPPADYCDVYEQVFDAIERRDTDGAVTCLSAYLERHDQRLIGLLTDTSKGHTT